MVQLYDAYGRDLTENPQYNGPYYNAQGDEVDSSGNPIKGSTATPAAGISTAGSSVVTPETASAATMAIPAKVISTSTGTTVLGGNTTPDPAPANGAVQAAAEADATAPNTTPGSMAAKAPLQDFSKGITTTQSVDHTTHYHHDALAKVDAAGEIGAQITRKNGDTEVTVYPELTRVKMGQDSKGWHLFVGYNDGTAEIGKQIELNGATTADVIAKLIQGVKAW